MPAAIHRHKRLSAADGPFLDIADGAMSDSQFQSGLAVVQSYQVAIRPLVGRLIEVRGHSEEWRKKYCLELATAIHDRACQVYQTAFHLLPDWDTDLFVETEQHLLWKTARSQAFNFSCARTRELCSHPRLGFLCQQ